MLNQSFSLNSISVIVKISTKISNKKIILSLFSKTIKVVDVLSPISDNT